MPMPKVPILKNARNYAEYLRKKERGPVKAFFHITKNENIPAIEQQGLLTEHPNANINSARHPFRKHGTDAGGVWVTTEPLAFPVYGTTIGGKYGNAAARADALSTIKIEVPVSELPTMRAVQDPYGKNILRKGNDSRAIQPFPTWAGESVPTTVFLDDMKPAWLKNLGYVEEARDLGGAATYPEFVGVSASWGLPSDVSAEVRALSKGDFKEFTGYTGHRHGMSSYDNAQRRFVDDYLDNNQPITVRLPRFPKPDYIEVTARRQGASLGPKYIPDGIAEIPAPNEANRYSADFIPASKWTSDYLDYVKPGESFTKSRDRTFAPGAISRGMGGSYLPSVKDRNFDWDVYNDNIRAGEPPQFAAFEAQPLTKLDWDNIVYRNGVYEPDILAAPKFTALSRGAISRGLDHARLSTAQAERDTRRVAADIIRNRKLKANAYLSRNLDRQPTAEEIDNWARAGVWHDIEAGEIMDVPAALGVWADKTDWNIGQRLTDELFHRMDNKRNKKTREP